MKVNLINTEKNSVTASLGISEERAAQMWEHVMDVFRKHSIYESMAYARTTAILRDAAEIAENNEEFLWVCYQTTCALLQQKMT